MTKTRGISHGTANFINKHAAYRYYGPEVAEYKLVHAEISIGKPATKEGQRAYINHQEGRWFIEQI